MLELLPLLAILVIGLGGASRSDYPEDNQGPTPSPPPPSE